MFDKSKKTYEINRLFNRAMIDLNLVALEEMMKEDDGKLINVNGFINESPFILYAAQNKRWDVVSFLYDNNANLDVSNTLGWHLIHECVKSAPEYVMEAIVEYADVNVQTKKGVSPLMLAIMENPNLAFILLDNSPVTVELLDENGNNAAHYAAKRKEYDIFLKLMEKGALINLKNVNGETPVDLIDDIYFKENLPKMAAIMGKQKSEAPDKILEALALENENKKEGNIRVVTGLSEIKRMSI